MCTNLLTNSILARCPYPGFPRFGVGSSGNKFVHVVRPSDNFFDIDALDGREAVLDEKGVGLPVLPAGAAFRRCEVFKGVYIEGRFDGSRMRESKEKDEDTKHCYRQMRMRDAELVHTAAVQTG